MIKFKKVDVWMSVFLITAGTIISAIVPEKSILYFYFIIGTWQIISMLTHLAFKWFTHSLQRTTYQLAVAIMLAIAVYGSVFSIPVLTDYLLLFISPLLAIYYTHLCYQESYVALKRPLAYLR